MKKLLPALLLLLAPPVFGEIYTWKDTRGTVHYTNSLHEIPERYRAKAKIMNLGIENKGASPAPAAGVASPAPPPQQALPLPVSPSPPPATALPSPPPASAPPATPPASVRQDRLGTDRASARALRARQRASREEE